MGHNHYFIVAALLMQVLASGAFQLTSPPTTTTNHITSFSRIATHLLAAMEGQKEIDDDDFLHEDPAETTPQLLKGIWEQISHAGDMEKGVSLLTMEWEVLKSCLTLHYLILTQFLNCNGCNNNRTKLLFCTPAWQNS